MWSITTFSLQTDWLYVFLQPPLCLPLLLLSSHLLFSFSSDLSFPAAVARWQMTNPQASLYVIFLCICFHVVSHLLLWILSKKGLKLITPHLWINHNVFLNTVTPTVTTRRHCFEPHKSSDWWVLQRYTPSHFHIPKIFKPNHITITFTHTAASFPQHALCSITFSLLAHVFVVVAIGSRG